MSSNNLTPLMLYFQFNWIAARSTLNFRTRDGVKCTMGVMYSICKLVNRIKHVNEYPTMHYFGNPRQNQSIVSYMIVTEYCWKFQWNIVLWECRIIVTKSSHEQLVSSYLILSRDRIMLKYGGRDITRTFSWLLDHISFPYIDCQHDSNILDALLLQELKHSYCHMDTVSLLLLSLF